MCKPQLVCIFVFIYAETNDSSSPSQDFEKDVEPFPSQLFVIGPPSLR
jgi:hypothetical protein